MAYLITILPYILLLFIGIFIGGILNVCMFRIPKDEEDVLWIWPRCKSCNHPLTIKDLIPFYGYLKLKGHCNACKEKLSYRYWLVPILTAVIYMILFYKYQLSMEFFAFSLLMSLLIMVFFIDLDYYIIPNGFVLIGIGAGVLLLVYNIFFEFEFFGDRAWWNPLVGGVLVSGIFFIIALVGYVIYKTEAMGMGDVKLLIPIGLIFGWRMVLVTFLLSIFIGSIVSVILMILRRKKKRDPVPFGPFITIGTFLTMLFGWEILNWYIQRYLNY